MKVEAAIFNLITVFCIVAAIVYGVWSHEPVGTTALVLSGGLTALIGGFFWFVSRRIDARPEDRKDAEIADGAWELGFFSPASYWPFGLALSAATMGLALAFWATKVLESLLFGLSTTDLATYLVTALLPGLAPSTLAEIATAAQSLPVDLREPLAAALGGPRAEGPEAHAVAVPSPHAPRRRSPRWPAPARRSPRRCAWSAARCARCRRSA